MHSNSRMLRHKRAAPVEREGHLHLDYANQLTTSSRDPVVDSVWTTVIREPLTSITITITRSPETTLASTRVTTTSKATPTSDITTETISSRSSSIEQPTSSPSPSSEPTSSDSQTVVPTESTPTVSPAPSSSSTNVPEASGATSASMSSGTIAGVVIGVLILVLGLGLFLCWFRRRRQGSHTKSPRWLRGTVGQFNQNDHNTRNVDSEGQSPYQDSSQFAPILPPVTYRNDAPITAALNSAAFSSGKTASVKLTFVPTLPDELSITNGETLQIVQEFDDGWAMCVKADGSEGMVPMECLVIEGALTPPRPVFSERRASSLSVNSGIRYL